MSDTTIEVLVVTHSENRCLYRAEWDDGDVIVEDIHEALLDLIPFMLARKLLEWGYNVEHELIVRLRGADYELMRAPLGAAAATPLINHNAPVKQGTRAMMRTRRRSYG